MVNEYTEFYNKIAPLLPSYPKQYLEKHPSRLYNRWITGRNIQYKYINSGYIMLAFGEAIANFKSSKTNINEDIIPIRENPNILKIPNNQYKIILTSQYKGVNLSCPDLKECFGILLNNGVYFPLNIGGYQEVFDYLMDCYKSKKKPGQLTYNLRENAISISIKIDSPRYLKKDKIQTIIGVDRGKNNWIVLSAIDKNKNVLRVKLVSGKEDYHKIEQIRRLQDKRKSAGVRNVGTKIRDFQDTLTHQLSHEIYEFTKQFPNPVVIFERLKFDRCRNKNGGKSTRRERKLLSKIAWNEIKNKTKYKLNEIGVWIMEINPAGTSQNCNHCGAIGIRDGIHFKCEKCGLGVGSNPTSIIGQYNADVNGSINIALKGFYSLYENKKGKPDVPIGSPNENIMNPIPTEMIDIERYKLNERKDENQVTNPFLRISNSTISNQPMVRVNQVDSISENDLSSPYKEVNKIKGRLKIDKKIDSRNELLRSKL